MTWLEILYRLCILGFLGAIFILIIVGIKFGDPYIMGLGLSLGFGLYLVESGDVEIRLRELESSKDILRSKRNDSH